MTLHETWLTNVIFMSQLSVRVMLNYFKITLLLKNVLGTVIWKMCERDVSAFRSGPLLYF